MKYSDTPEQRVMNFVVKGAPGECWGWTGSTTPFGYGQIRIHKKAYVVSRLAYTLFVGPIPSGMQVLHKCDNPPCCNPEHLFLGTQKDNIADAIAKSRHVAPPHPAGSRHRNSKLTEKSVLEIRASTEKYAILAERYGVCLGVIDTVKNRRSWKHI